MATFTVIRPGMLTTVQDLGRWGHQSEGIPVAGPMDWYAHRRANRLAGNEDEAPALEVTLIGPDLEADGDIVCAVDGASFEIAVNGQPAPTDGPFLVKAGEHLHFGARRRGARLAFAVRGGLAFTPILGSCATSLIARMGPLDGRPLKVGDVLRVGNLAARRALAPGRRMTLPGGGAKLRVIMGPHDATFTQRSLDAFRGRRFVVTPESNRMGYRLEGPALERRGKGDLLSDATPIGSLQVPPSGQPILLMADRQTTGGYPKIATVITADLPLAGQLGPGDWIEFVPVTRTGAIQALRAREAALLGRTE